MMLPDRVQLLKHKFIAHVPPLHQMTWPAPSPGCLDVMGPSACLSPEHSIMAPGGRQGVTQVPD